MGLGIVLLLLVVVPLMWPSSDPDRSDDGTTNTTLSSSSTTPPSEEPEATSPVVRPAPTNEDANHRDISQDVMISEWLGQARAHLAANRLTTPAGENALDLCARVLEVDASNREAFDIIRQIAQRYATWGDAQMQQGNASNAVGQYQKSLDVAQRYPVVLAQQVSTARQKLAEARQVAARPPAPAEEARQGTLRIVVRPFGDVYVEGQRKARETNQPYIEAVTAGAYRVRAVHPTFGRWEKTVSVRPGRTREVVFNFNREYTLTVTSQPPNAEILVDGTSTGRYTPSVVKVRPGQHSFRVRKQGYTASGGAKQLTIDQNIKDPVHFVLQRN